MFNFKHWNEDRVKGSAMDYIKFNPTEPLVINYDNIFMIPVNEEGIIHLDETLPRLSEEELIKALEELCKDGSNNI